MFSFAGTAQEAGAGGRSGAVGIPVRGLLVVVRGGGLSSFNFISVRCGSLVSTSVLSGEAECPVALHRSPTSVSGLAKKVAGHQGLQLKKVVGPDNKL